MEQYIGEIRMFGGDFAPVDWALCDGQLLSISENEALFALIGTTYGGDGQRTFALPDLRGRVVASQGQSTTGTTYSMGQAGGMEQVTLTPNELPAHSHLVGSAASGDMNESSNSLWAGGGANRFSNQSPNGHMHAELISSQGGSQPHENRMPILSVNYIISLVGIFPVQV